MIGAGVVGIAVARALAQAKRHVLVFEAADAVGTATSSCSSEVVHSGIYYPKGSQKAALCVRGQRHLQQFCRDKGVPYRDIGKLIVATAPDEVPVLHDLHARAIANVAGAVEFLTGAQAQRLEPALRCVAALQVGATAIVDARALMLALQADAEPRAPPL